MATKEEIIEYVMNSPQNTNRSVLSSMLEHMEGATVTIPVYYTVDDGATYTFVGNISGKPGDYFEKTIDNSDYAIDIVNWDNADHDAPHEAEVFYYCGSMLSGYIPNTIPQKFDCITLIMIP